MTTGKGYAPTAGKAKPLATPDVNRNNKQVKVNRDKKDKNSVSGTGAARKQKDVTWT